jgi:AraC family transcriptional regulator
MYRQVQRHWPGLTTRYAWVPPQDAVGVAQPNQVEVVFTAHTNAAYETRRHARQLDIAPGAAFIVGADAVTWSKVDEPNEALSMYPDMELLRHLAQPTNARRVELATTVDCRDPVLLSIAHVFRRACVTAQPLCDLHASSLAHLVAQRLLETYCGIQLPCTLVKGSKLSETAIHTVCDFIEANLCTQITLDTLAALVHLSPFHFARCFKTTTGLAPHQYVLARRIELAKRLLLTTTLSVAEVAGAIGYENISHFRRVFTFHTGLTPRDLRHAATCEHRP